MTTFTVEFDWARDGAWIDETSRLRRVQIRAGFERPHDAVAGVGRCTLTLDNADRRYSPANAESPLAGMLLPRRPVRVRASSGAQTWTLFRGEVEAIAPEAGAWGGACTITAVDGIALLARQPVTVGYAAAKAVDEAVAEIVAAAYTPPNTDYADNGDSLTHYGRTWQPEQVTVLDALRDVCAAVYGRFYLARDGTATFIVREARQNPSTPVALAVGG